MTRPAIALALLASLAAQPALACDIRTETWVTNGAIALDIGTTMSCLHRDRCHEANTWAYGSKHPSDERLIGTGIARIGLNTGIACLLDDHAPGALPIFNHLSLAVNGGVAVANLRFVF